MTSKNKKKKVLKGLHTIKTISNQTDKVTKPHKLMMRLTYLEIEKDRRMQEKGVLEHRIAIIDQRIDEIDKEKKDLLEKISKFEGWKDVFEGNLIKVTKIQKESISQNIDDETETINKGFKLKY